MARTLQKWHGAGNDFLVDVQVGANDGFWTPERAAAVCARTTGAGADGLLVAVTGDDVTMTLFNADGSLAEMSGNGIRCLVAAVLRTRDVSHADVRVRTAAGERVVSLAMDGNGHGTGSVAMGPVTLAQPLVGTLGVAHVGNPHVVVMDNPDWSDHERERLAHQWASQLGGANVEFVQLVDDGRVTIRVIERGVGWTQACGTGSCATAAVCHHRGLTTDDVVVVNPGGALHVTFTDDGAVLEGPVQFIADVTWMVG